MAYKIRNIKNYPIIGDTGDGSAIRLQSKESATITDKQYEGYIESLANAGIIEAQKVSESEIVVVEKPVEQEDKSAPQKRKKK